jgi:hypothetical protein
LGMGRERERERGGVEWMDVGNEMKQLTIEN